MQVVDKIVAISPRRLRQSADADYDENDGEGISVESHPRCSPAPGARALRRASLDGRNWINAGATPLEKGTSKLGRNITYGARSTRGRKPTQSSLV
jgi:hypothetical protein